MNILIINIIQKKIGYFFKKKFFLLKALTHSSKNINNNNERLEFLGDSIINFIVSNILYKKFPLINEGEISKIRSNLINHKTLFKISIKFNLIKYIKLNFKKLNNYNKNSILVNTFEALIGSIFLDSNINTIELLILNWYNKKFKNIKLSIKNNDYKTILQEIIQKKNIKLPNYSLIKIKGKPHNQKFLIKCKINCFKKYFIGFGKTKCNTEQYIAKKIIKKMEI
ncbi:MAG: ribonuclease III [Enterobacteriaceae bacterium PSpicST1]|nr:MAG: ribonuclease III [Enterobacteriaceae bacterium PSpicST1]